MGDVIPVRVAVRVRPFSAREKAEHSQECVQCFVEQSQIAINGKMFAFDSVFDPSSSQEMVYETCAAPLLEKIFRGYNCTILAYGQTGSGKTYTMGTEETPMSMLREERGITSRLVDAIFQQSSISGLHRVTASMFEIYEEKIIDLLCTTRRDPLQIREFPKGTFFVQELSIHPVSCLADAMDLLAKGCHLRSKGQTAMNDKSSRSHAIFTLTVEGKESEESALFKSKLHLVDLAGSERLKKTQAEGERMREGIKINEGLMALGNVIAALVENTERYIPYRESKLTRLLQDSLGGNSYTLMIACVSPADTNAEETLSTLRYADRAKRIQNKPIVNIDPRMALIQSLRDELASVKHELAMARAGESPTAYGGNQQKDGITRTCTKCLELEKKYRALTEDCRQRNLQFAEVVAENSVLIEQLLAANQVFEQLKEHFKQKDDTGEFEEAMNILDSAFNQQASAEEEKEKDSSYNATAEVDAEEETGDQGFVNRFAEKQMLLTKKMTNIIAEIKQKEMAFEATEASQAEIDKMRAKYVAELEELQAKLTALEKEKQELLDKLKGSNIHHKLSEERRKRLQELEKELAVNKKRLADIQRMEKENSRLQEQSKKLNDELTELKKLRVKMSRQMREEETKFRKWKLAAERKMMQMKNREQKREMEAARERHAINLQLAAYRRKYEDANACNRRLQQQLANCTSRRKACRDGQFISALSDELAVAYSAAEAQVHCDVLIEQRKNLSAQQEKLQKKLDRLNKEPPSKRRTGSDRSGIDNEAEKEVFEEQIKNLEKEIELRGSELGDIQKKCLKAYSDERREQRWNDLRSLADAKRGMDYLFDEAVNQRRAGFEKYMIMEEQRRTMEEMKEASAAIKDGLRKELKNMQISEENLRRALTQAELNRAEGERDMINMMNEIMEGRPEILDKVIGKMSLMKEAANGFTQFQQAFEERRHEQEKVRMLEKQGRVRHRNILTNSNKRVRSLSESITEGNQEDEEDLGVRRIREHRKPVQRLGVVTDLDAIFSDENEESVTVADSDYSYHPTPHRTARKRPPSMHCSAGRRDTFVLNEAPLKSDVKMKSEYQHVPDCSKEPDFSPNTTYTVEQPKQKAKLKPVSENNPQKIWDHRTIVTRQIFEKN